MRRVFLLFNSFNMLNFSDIDLLFRFNSSEESGFTFSFLDNSALRCRVNFFTLLFMLVMLLMLVMMNLFRDGSFNLFQLFSSQSFCFKLCFLSSSLLFFLSLLLFSDSLIKFSFFP